MSNLYSMEVSHLALQAASSSGSQGNAGTALTGIGNALGGLSGYLIAHGDARGKAAGAALGTLSLYFGGSGTALDIAANDLTPASFSGLAGSLAGSMAGGMLAGGFLGSPAGAMALALAMPYGLGGAILAGGLILGAGYLGGIIGQELGEWLATVPPQYCPLVLDLDGDGIDLVALPQSSAFFDFDNDGFAESSGWVGPNDGFLVLDRNGDGIINNVSEMFGGAAGGFAALAALDTNKDGVVNASDARFGELRIWRDANQDGYTDEGELHSLSDMGILSINLTSLASGAIVKGSTISRVGSYETTNGVMQIADVLFQSDQLKSIYLNNGNYELSPHLAMVPNIKGNGDVRDLRTACAEDAVLNGLVQSLIDDRNNFETYADFLLAFEPVVMRWLQVDAISPSSRGNRVDARVMTGYEKFLGVKYNPNGLPPSDEGARGIKAGWDAIVNKYAVAFLADLTNYDHFNHFVGAIHDLFQDLMATPEMDSLVVEQRVADAVALINGSPLKGPLLQEFTGYGYDAFNGAVVLPGDVQSLIDLYGSAFETFMDGTASPETFASMMKDMKKFLALAEWAEPGSALAASYIQAWNIFGGPVVRDINARLASPTSGGDLTGGAQHELIIGSEFGETLRGAEGQDILIGNGGNDHLVGGRGADRYIFSGNFGHDTISDGDTLGGIGDAVVFLDVVSSDVTFTRSGLDLIIASPDNSKSVRVIGQFDQGRWYQIESFSFADGVTLTDAQVRAHFLQSTDGDDVITGFHWNDEIRGGLGNDYMQGGRGDDAYYYSLGDGNDTVHDKGVISVDTIVLENIELSEVTIIRSPTNAKDLMVMMPDGGSIRVVNQFDSLAWDRIEVFKFADQSVSWQQVLAHVNGTAPIVTGAVSTTGYSAEEYHLGDDSMMDIEVLPRSDENQSLDQILFVRHVELDYLMA
ncbi:MAG: calcium-binding protein [Brevundimonas sp.]|uniref:calcium-binding protein n=1 Tax=Brevundimonas sp. TaxID=1871086 RepID=UPI003918A178